MVLDDKFIVLSIAIAMAVAAAAAPLYVCMCVAVCEIITIWLETGLIRHVASIKQPHKLLQAR